MESTELYHIGGHKVMFPFKPYPSQFDMMNKIISGLDKRLNCLLESPTGSGKTLSLLCSSLAWQKTEAAKIEILNNENKKNICEFCWNPSLYHQTYHVQPQQKKTKLANKKTDNPKKQCKSSVVTKQCESEESDDDFRDFSEMVKANRTVQPSSKSSRGNVKIGYEDTAVSETGVTGGCGDCCDGCNEDNPELSFTDCEQCYCRCNGNTDSTSKKLRVPTIFFGTRTHKQIKQIVDELKETQYKDAKMCILSSRENLCINEEVRSKPSINEACKEFVEYQKCSYKHGAMKFSTHSAIKSFGLEDTWDIEDLVKVCRSKMMRACPYFLTRSLMKDSNVVFCPYNYLLDPTIRQVMDIKLKGNIVILDEGHNVEDSCRESISYTITVTLLTILIKELNALVKDERIGHKFQYLLDLVHILYSFIHNRSADLQNTDFNQASKIWSGFEAVAELVNMKLGPKDICYLSNCLKELRDMQEKNKQKSVKMPRLSSAGFQMFGQLLVTLTYFYMNEMKNVEDFRLVLLRSVTFGPKKGSRSKNRTGNYDPREELTLHLWCLNPGVTFSDFSVTRSVIITSGTLSPMVSFQSELELPFSIRMEARHVIPPSQVLVRAIGCGPSGRSLVATYKHTETFTFQDDLGDIVHDVCQRTPNGVLCFLSSYTLLDKLSKRWQAVGLWEKIWQHKRIVTEPRTGKKEDFTKAWKEFKSYAEGEFTKCEESDEEVSQTGALFLAVCRGKLSEGIDFADNSARAVITVGIPYPNVKDIQVSLKKEYNELHKRTKNLLPGNEWLEIQAFRALNQALGRCIRHKNDWGALLLVDSRFLQGNRYHKGLSKWVRDMLKSQPNYHIAMESLSTFVKDKKKIDNLSQEKFSNSIENCHSETNDLQIKPIKASTPIVKHRSGIYSENEADRNILTPEGTENLSKPITQDIADLSSVLAPGSPSCKIDANFVETLSQPTESSVIDKSETKNKLDNVSDRKAPSDCNLNTDSDSQMIAKENSHLKQTQEVLKEDCPLKQPPVEAKDSCQLESSTLAAYNAVICKDHLNAPLIPQEVKVDNSETNKGNTKGDREITSDHFENSSVNGSPILFDEINDYADDAELLSMVESEAERSITKEFNWSDELSESLSQSSCDMDATLKGSDKKGNSTLVSSKNCSNDSSGEMFNDDPDLMTFIENNTKIDSFSSVNSSSPASTSVYKQGNSKITGLNTSTISNNKLQRCPLFKAASNHPNVTTTKTDLKNDLQEGGRLLSVDRDPFAELLPFESQELKLKRSVVRKRRTSGNHMKHNKKSRGVNFDAGDETEEFVILCKNCHRNLFSVHSNIEKRIRMPAFLQDVFTDKRHVFLYLAANTSDQLDSVSTVVSQTSNGAVLNSCWLPHYGCCVEYLQCVCDNEVKHRIIGVRVLLGSTDIPAGQLWLLDEAVTINSAHD
ncbi:Fanconi anemia group J protein homolog [Argonauta hians]